MKAKKLNISQQDVRKHFVYHKHGYLIRITNSSPRGPRLAGKRFGTPHNKGYRQGSFMKQLCLEHRLVYLYHYGFIPSQIDHINGDKQDNRIENLRPATQSQNKCNMGPQANNQLGIKGVKLDRQTQKYVATINVNRKCINLGYFAQLEDAIEARNAAVRKYQGEFGVLSKIPD